MNIKEVVELFRNIKDEYKHNTDVMCLDDPRVDRLKWIIEHRLSQADRTIILLYIECQSYRKLGEMLQLSHMTVRKEVIRIKEIILEEYNNGSTK